MLFTHISGEPPPHALCLQREGMQQRFVHMCARDHYLLLDEDDTAFVCDQVRRLPTADGVPLIDPRTFTSDPRVKVLIYGHLFNLDERAWRWAGEQLPAAT